MDFRGSICASVNEELVHGIPGSVSLKKEISSVSISVPNTMAIMVILLGHIQLERFHEENQKLLDVTEAIVIYGFRRS